MHNSFEYKSGIKPVLISMPHNSSLIPQKTACLMTQSARMSEDTDWFVDRLYDFSTELGVHCIKPIWSRYYIDLNRDPSGKDLYPGADNTELCPTTDFFSRPLYLENSLPNTEEIEHRINIAWQPYHTALSDILEKMVAEHGYAILFDAHSIRSEVPRFFEGRLPDFNFGNANGISCSESIISSIDKLDFAPYSRISNGRFKGGYITRHFGKPDNNVHAIQLELSQATYLNEQTLSWDLDKAKKVKIKLKKIIECLINWQVIT